MAGLRAHALAAAGVDADRTGIPGRPRIAAVAACASPGLVRGGNLAGGLAQALHPLGGLDELDARVVDRRRRHDRGQERAVGHVLIRRVAAHRVEHGARGQRVAPLLPLADGERQGRVQDRGERVHEGHARQDRAETVGGGVGDRAHEQATGAAALRDQAAGRHPPGVDQPVGDVDEVREGVLLDQLLTVLVPGAAHLAAAAHVRDRVDDAAQDRQAQGLELGVVADLVRAVPDLPARVRPVRARVAVVNEGDGDAGRAVAREHPHALLDVLGGVPAGCLAGAQGAYAQRRGLACVLGGRGLGRVIGSASLRGCRGGGARGGGVWQGHLGDRGRHGL